MKFSRSTSSNKTSGFDFKSPKGLAIIGVVVLILLLSFFLLSGGDEQEIAEEVSNNFEANSTAQVAPPPPPPPAIDESNLQKVLEQSDSNDTQALKKPTFDESTVATSNKNQDEVNRLIEDLSSNDGLNADGSKKEIKPEDMIIYLKAKQDTFKFSGNDDFFEFDTKLYRANDVFKGWWKIEEINPNFIRFEDKENGYAYNLRFL